MALYCKNYHPVPTFPSIQTHGLFLTVLLVPPPTTSIGRAWVICWFRCCEPLIDQLTVLTHIRQVGSRNCRSHCRVPLALEKRPVKRLAKKPMKKPARKPTSRQIKSLSKKPAKKRHLIKCIHLSLTRKPFQQFLLKRLVPTPLTYGAKAKIPTSMITSTSTGPGTTYKVSSNLWKKAG